VSCSKLSGLLPTCVYLPARRASEQETRLQCLTRTDSELKWGGNIQTSVDSK
jgi:hypothetical protein